MLLAPVMPFIKFSVSFLVSSAALPSPESSPAGDAGQAVTFAEFFDTTWTADCQKFFAPKPNPYSRVTFWESRPHAEGIAAWRGYYAQLPEKCHPKPYDMGIADGKTKEEALKDQAAYVRLQELVVSDPALVDSYFQEIFQGKTPGQAYCHWVRHGKLLSDKEWQPDLDPTE